MKRIDMENWDRRELYSLFLQNPNPFYAATFTVDVTPLLEDCRRRRLSFYLSLVWLCTKVMNGIENFRYGADEEGVYLHSRLDPSFTDLKPGSSLFHITTLEMLPDRQEFIRAAKAKSAAQTGFINYEEEADNLIYSSCVPNLPLTALTSVRIAADEKGARNNITHVTWGSYTQREGRYELGMTLEVNHRFIDGYHLALFFQRLNESMQSLRNG